MSPRQIRHGDRYGIMAEITTTASEEIRETKPLVRVTMAQGLLLLVLILAGVMRLAELEALPLSPAEVEEALAVWRLGQAEAAGPAFTASPAYFSLTALLSQIAGYGEATMRLVPALAGLLLVALPWLWRERLGTVGALTTSALLAGSPAAAIVARTAGGDSLAALAVLLLLISWSRYQRSGRTLWLYTAAAAAGLGLASGPLFYSGLLTLAAAGLVRARLGPEPSPPLSPDGHEPARAVMRNAALVGAATFAALATLLFWHPAGLANAATQAGIWLGNFTLEGTLSAWLEPLLVLGRYEISVIVLGIGATGWAMWQGRPFAVFLVYWFAAILPLALLQHGTMSNVLLLALPVYLLLGLWAESIFKQPAGYSRWALLLALLVLGAIATFNSARFLRIAAFSPGQLSFLVLVFLAFILALLAVNVVRTWDQAAAWQGSLLALLLLLLIYQWGTGWWLVREGANDPRARWAQTGTDDDVRLLAALLTDVSQQVDGSGTGLEIVAAVESPVLRWYLRAFPNLQMGGTVPPGTTAPAIITPTGSEPALGDDYFGIDLGLRHTGIDFVNTSFGGALRWWFFHESSTVVTGERVILWVRNDALQ